MYIPIPFLNFLITFHSGRLVLTRVLVVMTIAGISEDLCVCMLFFWRG